MNNFFDGKKIRDQILKELADKVAKMDQKPTMAVFLVGNNPVCEKYVELKKKLAEKAGIQFCLYKFTEKDCEKDIIDSIEFLNNDSETDGIMIQIPVAGKFDRDKLIRAISPKKDIDGLRYCLGFDSDFYPPVVKAILEALEQSRARDKKILVIGKGFLVGTPLLKALKNEGIKADSFDRRNGDISNQIKGYDVIISATGQAGIVKEDMIKDGAVLIDAGTAEENGELKGDMDVSAYKKASYYTPVPGGIGPVTVAMLFQNLIRKDHSS